MSCRKPGASWRINMNQLINYVSGPCRFQTWRDQWNQRVWKNIKKTDGKTIAMQRFRNSVCISRSAAFLDTTACDTAMLYLAHFSFRQSGFIIRSYKIHPSEAILMKCDRPQRKFHTVALWQSGPSELHPESWKTWMDGEEKGPPRWMLWKYNSSYWGPWW